MDKPGYTKGPWVVKRGTDQEHEGAAEMSDRTTPVSDTGGDT